jgi:hypothetical protein
MTTKAYILPILVLLLFVGPLQFLAQNSPVSAGGEASGTQGKLSYSVGQVDYITASGPQGNMTAGVQQPYLIQVSTGIENQSIQLVCALYPNPTNDYVILQIEEPIVSNLSFILSDLTGKQVLFEKITEGQTHILFSGLPDAVYLLTVFDNRHSLKSFKIIKNQ